jgi:hypothetical protein
LFRTGESWTSKEPGKDCAFCKKTVRQGVPAKLFSQTDVAFTFIIIQGNFNFSLHFLKIKSSEYNCKEKQAVAKTLAKK